MRFFLPILSCLAAMLVESVFATSSAQGPRSGVIRYFEMNPQDPSSNSRFDELSAETLQVVYGALVYARRDIATDPSLDGVKVRHVMEAMIRVSPATIERFLASDWSLQRLERALTPEAVSKSGSIPQEVGIPASPEVAIALERASLMAKELGARVVTPGHLLAAILRVDDEITRLLQTAGLTTDGVADALREGKLK